jgi:hypothetical protein
MTACFLSKFTRTFLTHGKDLSALRTRGGHRIGQDMPETAILTRLVLPERLLSPG